MNTNSEFVGRHPIIRDGERKQLRASNLFDRGVRLIVGRLREPSTDLIEELKFSSNRLARVFSIEAPKPIVQKKAYSTIQVVAGGLAAHETVHTVAEIDPKDRTIRELSDLDVDAMFETIVVKCL